MTKIQSNGRCKPMTDAEWDERKRAHDERLSTILDRFSRASKRFDEDTKRTVSGLVKWPAGALK